MFRKYLFCFEKFKYYQFVWCKNLTRDNNFIFYLQCHTLASLFLNMPSGKCQGILFLLECGNPVQDRTVRSVFVCYLSEYIV